MTEILCRWLKEELPSAGTITPVQIPELFSSGYLFGSILSKHGIQEDFKSFTNANTTESKLNNFLRLETTFSLLNIRFDTNAAHDVMLEKQGVATKLLYQLYVALQRKEKQHLTGQSLRSMKPTGKAMLENMEKSFFHGRMKQMPRQVDLNFVELANTFKDKHREREEKIVKELREEEEKLILERKDACQKSLEKSHQLKESQDQLHTKLKPIHIPKSVPSKKARTKSKEKQNKAIAETQAQINTFEATHQHTLPESCTQPDSTEDSTGTTHRQDMREVVGDLGDSGGDYMDQIRKRVGDSNFAQKERERRRRKVLMDQMRSLRHQQESHREELLVSHMLRQCQQEQRIATQLMQVRAEKENIRNNRMELARQFQERRQKDFQEYLQRQAELIESEKKANKLQLEEEMRHREALLKEKASKKKTERRALVADTLDGILDYVFRICEYKADTGGLLPAKLVRDWKLKFLSGHPLHDQSPDSSACIEEDSEEWRAERGAQVLLDDADFFDYHECRGAWSPPTAGEDARPMPPPLNPILGYFVHKIYRQVYPPKPPPEPPVFPSFKLKASCLGRPFSGVNTLVQRLAKDFSVQVVSVERLVEKAIQACEDSTPTSMVGSRSTLVASQSSLSTAGVLPTNPSETQEEGGEGGGGGKDGTSPTPARTVPVADEPNLLSVSTEDKDQTGSPAEGTAHQPSLELTAAPKEEEEEDVPTWAGLGKKSLEASQQGAPIPDHVVVNLVVLQLRELADGSRFVLSDFPTTFDQAVLLEKLLSGYTPRDTPPKQRSLLAGSEGVYLLIASPPSVAPTAPVHGLDVVVHVDTEAGVCVSRGIEGGERKGERQQVLAGLSSFDSSWPEVREFYLQFNNVFTVDGGRSEDDAYEDLKQALSQYIPHRVKIQQPHSNLKSQSFSGGLKQASNSALKQPSSSSLKQSSSTSLKQDSTPSMKQGSQTQIKQVSTHSLKQSSKASVTPETSQEKTSVSIAQVPTDQSIDITSPTPVAEPEPGSEEWVYVDSTLPEEVSRALALKWPGVEKVYVSTCLGLFRNIRVGREEMYKYFALRRWEYGVYLCRPDVKQEYVTQWQQNYNALQDHLRREDVVKAEQHCRVDDLCDKLWDICDERKKEAEEEKTRIALERWLEDRTGLLCNYYFMLIQTELVRFYETVQLQRDYYYAMEDPTPSELLPSTQVPLIQMPTSTPADTASMQDILSSQSLSPAPAPLAEVKSEEVVSKKGGQSSKEDLSKSTSSLFGKKLVLIPEKVPAPEQVEEKGGKKKGGSAAVDPPPPLDDEEVNVSEAIICHVTEKARSYVSSTIAQLTAVLAVPALPTPTTSATPNDTPKADDKSKAKKGKDKIDKTPSKTSAKKVRGSGRDSKAPPPEEPTPSPVVSQDDIKKRQLLERMRKEELFSHKLEGERLCMRVDLIQAMLLRVITDLKTNAESMYSDMEEWLVQQYKAEVDSISKLAEVLREIIEDEAKIFHELTLPGTDFVINEGAVLYEPNPSPPVDTPTEEEYPNYFTVNQLRTMMSEFKCIAPNGSLPFRAFIDAFKLLVTRTSGEDVLPSIWSGVRTCSSEVLGDHIRAMLSVPDPKVLDWRRFLLLLAWPHPLPTSHQLVQALQSLTSAAPQGLIARDKFLQTPLWLDSSEEEREGLFNRSKAVKELFFDLFVGAKTGELNYFTLLLHCCADSSLQEGTMKGLSLVIRSPVLSSSVLLGQGGGSSGPPLEAPPPSISCSDLLRLHKFAYQQPLEGPTTLAAEALIQELFQSHSSPGLPPLTIPLSLLFTTQLVDSVLAGWTKLLRKPLPEITAVPDHEPVSHGQQ